jgi:hypothetical protein
VAVTVIAPAAGGVVVPLKLIFTWTVSVVVKEVVWN